MLTRDENGACFYEKSGKIFAGPHHSKTKLTWEEKGGSAHQQLLMDAKSPSWDVCYLRVVIGGKKAEFGKSLGAKRSC